MNVDIDFSVFCGDVGALGRVYGTIEISGIPPIGASLVLRSSIMKTAPVSVKEFTGQFQIENILIFPTKSREVSVSLSLADITLMTIADAREVIRFLEQGFALFFDEYD